MSWMPSNDPILGDPQSCNALDLIIVPRTRDLGDGFGVRRALPHGRRQMVGPSSSSIISARCSSSQARDGRAAASAIGLATVTYLFDGSIMHRDSEGHIQEIKPGAMNLMTAGRGIAHSERTPDVERAQGQSMLGLQSWIALPAGREEIAPSFQHFSAETLPTVQDTGFKARVIAGSAFGAARRSTGCRSVYVEGRAGSRRRRAARRRPRERAIYVVDGEIEIAGERFEGPPAPDLPPRRPHHRARHAAGTDDSSADRAGRPRPYWWNFVSSTRSASSMPSRLKPDASQRCRTRPSSSVAGMILACHHRTDASGTGRLLP